MTMKLSEREWNKIPWRRKIAIMNQDARRKRNADVKPLAESRGWTRPTTDNPSDQFK